MKIVVIGGGVAGLSIGWRLAQAGEEVTVLERASPGQGATAASAGMLAVTAEHLDATQAERDFAFRSKGLWPGFAQEVETVSGRAIGYKEVGALILAEDAIGLDRLWRQAAGARDTELVNAARVREIAPLATGAIAGGLWSKEEAIVNNRALGWALASVFQKAGGNLKINEAAVRIERKEGRAAVAHTPFGLHHADLFVLAAGAWSGLLEKDMAPIIPVKGEMIWLAPPPTQTPPNFVIWGHGVYAVPRDGGLMIGATVEEAGFDTATTEKARQALLSAATGLMPSLRNWRIEDQWAGLRPRAPDGLPLLGPSAVEGLWLASGQYRNGILFAPALAEALSQQILGKAPGIAAFDPKRFAS
ncbi:MAG: glycine oxidase ThiO [Rhizomicrobium sp.]